MASALIDDEIFVMNSLPYGGIFLSKTATSKGAYLEADRLAEELRIYLTAKAIIF